MDRQSSIESYNAGLALASQGEWEAASDALRRSLQMYPGNVEALNLLGKVCIHLGDRRQAEILWLQALAKDPGNPTARACLDALPPRRVGRWLVRGLVAVLLLFSIGMLFWLLMEVRLMRQQIQVLQGRPAVVTTARASTEPSEPTQSSEPTQPLPQAPAEALSPEPVPLQFDASISTQSLYDQAIRDYRAAGYADAEAKLREVLRRADLRADYRDNLLYWLGACAQAQGRLDEAEEYFQQVLHEYPAGNKVADAQAGLRQIRKRQHTR